MIDTKELRRLAQQIESGEAGINELVAFVESSEPKAIVEILDCLEAAEKERDALRAHIEAMEKQEPSHWGCTVLQSDCTWKEEVSREAPPEGYFSIRDIFPLYALPGAQTQPTSSVQNVPTKNLKPVIDWLRNGCDPMRAADELELLIAAAPEDNRKRRTSVSSR